MTTLGVDGNKLDLTVSAQLIEDYLDVADPPAPDLGEGEIAAFSNGVIAIDGSRLMLFERDETRQSGWSVSTIAVPVPETATSTNIERLCVFELSGMESGEGATTINVLCQFPAPDGCFAVCWLARTQRGNQAPGPWQPLSNIDSGAKSLLSQVKQIGAVDGGCDIGWIVYGMTNDILQPQTGIVFTLYLGTYDAILTFDWTILSQIPRSALPSTRSAARIGLAAAMTSGGSSAPHAMVLCCHDDQTFFWSQLAAGGADLTTAASYRNFQPQTGFVSEFTASPAIDQAVPFAGDHRWDVFVVDSKEYLWRYTVTETSLQPTCLVDPSAPPPSGPLRNPPAANHLALATHGGVRSAFLVDATRSLWMVDDITSSSTAWVRLGNTVNAIAAPSSESVPVQVYYADGGGTQQNQIYRLSQAAPGGVWQDEKIATFVTSTDPGKALTPVATIALEIAVTHDGKPVPGASVSVAADQLVTLILGPTQTALAGPGAMPIVTTDATGRATIRYWAKSMSFATLDLTASSAADNLNSDTIVCHGDVVDGDAPPATSLARRLNGDDDHTGDAKRFSLDPKRLVAKGLLPAGTSDHDGTHVVTMLNTIGGYMKGQSSASTESKASVGGRSWDVTIKGDGSFSCAETTSSDLLGWSFDDWTDIASDVVHWAKHTVSVAAKWTVHVAGDAIHFAIAGYKCAIKTAREAADLVGTILQTIQRGLKDVETFIKEVVDFFKVLFDWDDILTTHKALKHIFTFFLKFASDDTRLRNAINAYIGKVKDKIEDGLESAETYFANDTTTSASGFADTTAGQQHVLAATSYKTHLKQHGSRCHYVLGHAKGHAGVPTSGGTFNGGNISTHWNTAANKASANGLKNRLNSNDPAAGNLLTGPGAIVFDMLKSLVSAALDGLEAIVDDVLAMIQAAIGEFANILEQDLDIPLVSWLYKYVITSPDPLLFEAGDDLSILDLFSLVLAAPTTILFKLVTEAIAPFDGAAPFDTDRLAAVKAIFNLDTLTINAGAPAMPRLGASLEASPDLSTIAATMGVCAGVIGLFVSGLSTYLDYRTITDAAEGSTTSTLDTFLGYVSVFAGAYTTALIAPLANFADIPHVGEEDVVQFLYWGSQWLPIVSDFCALYFEKGITRMIPGYGPIAEGLFGFLIAGLGCTCAVFGGASKWDISNIVLTVFPRPWRMIIAGVDPGTAEDAPVVMAIIMVTDAIGLVGGTATQIGAAISDNT